MISVIISTYQPDLLQQVSKNINETIGVDFEIIAIENHAKFSICEAYNQGIKKSKFPFLCFVHEDVLFETQSWGAKLTSLMKGDTSIGLIGVAGTKFKSSYPSAWGQSPYLSKFRRGQIIHQLNNKTEEYLDFDESMQHKEIEDVICVDGVFLFTKKEIFNTCSFDEKLLKHFHGYDIDFSLQVSENFRTIIHRGILIRHFSGGNYSKQNTIANRLISSKWRSKLPKATADLNLSRRKILQFDLLNWYHFLKKALIRKLTNQ